MKIKNILMTFSIGLIVTLCSCKQTNVVDDNTIVDKNSGTVTSTSYITDDRKIITTNSMAIITTNSTETTIKNSTETTTITTICSTTKNLVAKPILVEPMNNETTIEIFVAPKDLNYNYSLDNIEELTSIKIDDYSKILLAEITYHEAGCDWLSIYDKARIVAGVMNRVYDERFPSTVYEVLTQEGQFTGYWPGCVIPTQECYDAVDYYFEHSNEFGNENSWFGNGVENIFYYQ